MSSLIVYKNLTKRSKCIKFCIRKHLNWNNQQRRGDIMAEELQYRQKPEQVEEWNDTADADALDVVNKALETVYASIAVPQKISINPFVMPNWFFSEKLMFSFWAKVLHRLVKGSGGLIKMQELPYRRKITVVIEQSGAIEFRISFHPLTWLKAVWTSDFQYVDTSYGNEGKAYQYVCKSDSEDKMSRWGAWLLFRDFEMQLTERITEATDTAVRLNDEVILHTTIMCENF